MNDSENQEHRRRATSMTAIPDNVAEQARYCVELIDVLTRRQDLAGREDLVSVATSLRLLVPPGTSIVSERDLVDLVEVLGVAMRVAASRSNTFLPTVAEMRTAGRSFPHPEVLESAARFFEWRSRDDANGRHELVTAAIDLSRVCGLLTPPTSVWRDDSVMLRAAANVVAATRVAVALADPDPGSAYQIWREEDRMKRQVVIDELEKSLAEHRSESLPLDVN